MLMHFHPVSYFKYCINNFVFFFQKSDDADSGNDEPADIFYPIDRLQMSSSQNDNKDRPPPPDSVARRLELLTMLVPHRYLNENKSNLIHVESLPPEGKK